MEAVLTSVPLAHPPSQWPKSGTMEPLRTLNPSRTALSALAVLFGALVFAPAAEAKVHVAAYHGWQGLDQAACMARAGDAVRSAAERFRLGAARSYDGWYDGARSEETRAVVYCAGDDETGRLANPQAPRVLVNVEAASTRAGVVAPLRDHLRDCMLSGACAAAQPPTQPPVRSGGGAYAVWPALSVARTSRSS